MSSSWGQSWGQSWGNSWGDISPAVTRGWVGPQRKKRSEKRDKDFREAQERLREQIRFALEGPRAEEVRLELEAIAEPQKADSVYVPLVDRIDVEALIARVELRIKIEDAARHAAKMQEIDEDDEEIFSLVARL